TGPPIGSVTDRLAHPTTWGRLCGPPSTKAWLPACHRRRWRTPSSTPSWPTSSSPPATRRTWPRRPSGAWTRPMARLRVWAAVDVSPVMLTRLRHQVEASGHPNIEAVEGGFLTYEHTGSAADVVYSRNALHHVPDFWKAVALQRVAAMLRPGAVFRLRDLVYN